MRLTPEGRRRLEHPTMHATMRKDTFVRFFTQRTAIFVAALALFAAPVVPARADVDATGTYSCITRTGLRFVTQIIENDNGHISGTYVFNASEISGSYSGEIDNNGNLSYTWTQKAGDGGNTGYNHGWGNMTWDLNGGMKAAWGRDSNGSAVGFWTCHK
jgi:hypothetical protein